MFVFFVTYFVMLRNKKAEKYLCGNQIYFVCLMPKIADRKLDEIKLLWDSLNRKIFQA